jgi:hypothetical protein
MFGFALVLLLLAMTAIGVTLTGIGGLVAEVAGIVFIVTLGFAVTALALARGRTSGFGDSPFNESANQRWDPRRAGTAYHLGMKPPDRWLRFASDGATRATSLRTVGCDPARVCPNHSSTHKREARPHLPGAGEDEPCANGAQTAPHQEGSAWRRS